MVPFINTTAIGPDADPTVENKSKVFDVRSLRRWSLEAVLAGGSGSPIVVVTVYASNQPPPNGGAPNRGWQPDASSWYSLGTGTLTGAGTLQLEGNVTASWLYIDTGASGATGGALTVDVNIQAQAQ